MEYDYVIVGAGLSGLTLAERIVIECGIYETLKLSEIATNFAAMIYGYCIIKRIKNQSPAFAL